MRKSITLLSGFLLLGGATATPQSHLEEFQKFRHQILSDFDSFKSRILEHYDDFLNGEWHDFEPLWEEESPYREPKPEAMPEAPAIPEADPKPEAARLPDPNPTEDAETGVLCAAPGNRARDLAADFSHGGIPGSGPGKMKIDRSRLGSGSMPATMAQSPTAAAFVKSELAGKSNYEIAVLRLPDPGFAFGTFPGQIQAPTPDEAGIVNIDFADRRTGTAEDNFFFDFYGMEAFIPDIDFRIAKSVSGPAETGQHWKEMAGQDGGLETARQLFGLAQQLGLNGYLTFRLTESFVDRKFKDSDQGARMSAVHFLLSSMGYDVRLINIEDMLTVMMPFDQKVVYATMSQTIDGRKYTILFPEGYQPPMGEPLRMSTCSLPSNGLGKTSDLRLTGLSLPMKARDFTLTNGDLTLKGEVNENIARLLYRYPQMPAGDFASSWIDSDLREDLVGQLKGQLNGMTPKDAVNSLMALCHKGFDYATDQDQHGFEKPYFLEENFIYDRNDCEDRAIFFSYLLWNALGLPCQLIQYPGHESAVVAVDEEVAGYYYDTDGTRYYSADPTYIGSSVGMVMKPFRSTAPIVDKHYR